MRRLIAGLMLLTAACSRGVAEKAEPVAPADPTAEAEHYRQVKLWNDTVAWNEAVRAHELELFYEAVRWQQLAAWIEGVQRAEAERAAAAAAAARRSAPKPPAAGRGAPPVGGGGSVGGGCGVPPDNGDAPPGFPDSVIQKESSGRRDASNGSHFGRAQISCQHYAPGGGCVGLSYSDCWSKLWNGGAGASNWAETIG